MSEASDNANPFMCPYCKYVFSQINKCTRHMVKCKVKKDNASSRFVCDCDKSYKYKQGLQTHQQKCATYQTNINKTTTNNGVMANINNGNIYNTNNSPVIQINPVGQESFSHLSDADIQSVLNAGNGAFKKLAFLMYANPENKNVTFHNRKDGLVKHVNMDNMIEFGDTEKVLNQAVTSVEDQLDEYISNYCADEEKGNSYIGRLLSELSEAHAEGTHDAKNLRTIMKIIILISSVTKQLLAKYEKSLIESGKC